MDSLRHFLKYPYAELGTPLVILAAIFLNSAGKKWLGRKQRNFHEHYRKRQILVTVLVVGSTLAVIVLWARLLEYTGTFLGLLVGGLAIALREPLLAIAGRIAILTGRAYSVGDRIQIESVVGDVIDIGFFYTRLMELGNWIGGDQATGRIVQFSNSKIFGTTPVYNYTRDFGYIWDELMLPLTYDSDIQAATGILLEAAGQYTREFLDGAQAQIQQMRQYFLVPDFELKPQVFMTVTSNWVELRMRYVVDPKKRRVACNFIWQHAFKHLQGRKGITVASQTSNVAIHWREAESSAPVGRPEGDARRKHEPREVVE